MAEIAERVWKPEQVMFQTWLATPADLRTPANQRLYAAKFGRNEGTLSEWKRLPGWADEVYRLTREIVKTEALACILGAQAKLACSDAPNSTQAARFVFEAVGALSAGGTAVNIDNRTQILIREYGGFDPE